ncbi:MAG: ankyrin repeat domain-containing protein [Coxiellaceae bacterium]|nr:MAG: ankyrin repeat domain-containing protein [Coxiellaceae bacterium]
MRGEIPNSYFDAATTPMHAAIARQDNTMISDFIDNKSADTALRDSKGDTPLHRASELNYQRIVMTLYNKGARKSKVIKIPEKHSCIILRLGQTVHFSTK